jgi:hypothetical protein
VIPMSNAANPDSLGSHHYPPTTADWVTSPLAHDDEMQQNPLEPSPATKPGQRLGALLLIGGGLLAIPGLLLQFAEMNAWYALPVLVAILAIGAAALAVGAAVRGISLLARSSAVRVDQAILLAFASSFVQIIASGIVVVLVASGSRQILGTSGTVVATVGALCLLLGGSILRFIVRPNLSGLEVVEQAEKDKRMVEFTRGRREGKTYLPWR